MRRSRPLGVGQRWVSSAARRLIIFELGKGSAPWSARADGAYDAAPTGQTHLIVLIIPFLGTPVVLASTVGIYDIFRGKVKLAPHTS